MSSQSAENLVTEPGFLSNPILKPLIAQMYSNKRGIMRRITIQVEHIILS